MEHEIFSPHDVRFSVGELSEMYGVTSRTLRLYHERGLLVPQYVDPRTGYRYYTPAQLPRLEVILQMKSIGLSLKRIENVLKSRDLSVFEALLNEQIDELDEKILQYTASRKALMSQLSSCKYLRNPPALEHIFIEFISKRRALIFDIEPYDFRKNYGELSPWKVALDKIRVSIADRNILLTLFRQIGCMIRREDLEQNHFLCSKACILLNTENPELPQVTLQSGIYACMYQQYVSMDNSAESEGLERLMTYIQENHYRIVGPYLGEVIAENSVFDYSNRNILVKLQIPIALAERPE